MAKWNDNFVKPENTPPEPQKRPGICDNCGHGGFTLELEKMGLKRQLVRYCKKCDQKENPDTGEVLRGGEIATD